MRSSRTLEDGGHGPLGGVGMRDGRWRSDEGHRGGEGVKEAPMKLRKVQRGGDVNEAVADLKTAFV